MHFRYHELILKTLVARICRIYEISSLLVTDSVFRLKRVFEVIKLIPSYLKQKELIHIDWLFKKYYFLQSPYRISKEYNQIHGIEPIHNYGETWASSACKLKKICGLTHKDILVELGSGTGRFCFWVNKVIGCRVVGIELISQFVDIAKKIQQQLHIDELKFIKADIQDMDYSFASVIYFYGTSFDADTIERLIEKFQTLPQGAKIITVSFPLNHYTVAAQFVLIKEFSLRFPWGKAKVFLQEKTTPSNSLYR